MLIPTLILTSFLCCTHAERTDTADVLAFVAKYRKMNETDDVVGSLERMGSACRELFRLGRPVAELLGSVVNGDEVNGDNGEAMNELQTIFEPGIFEDSDRYILDEFGVYFNVSSRKSNYPNKLFDPLHTLEVGCRDNFYGKEIQLLEEGARTNCQIPDKDKIIRLFRSHQAFGQVESRIQGNWTEVELQNWNNETDGFMQQPFLSRSTEDEFCQFVKKLEDLDDSSYSSATDALFVYRNATIQARRDACIMDSSTLFAFNHSTIFSKLHKLHTDMLRMALLKWVLISVNKSDEETYNASAESVTKIVERTSAFLADWTRTVQNISLPEVGKEFANEACGDSTICTIV
ncbi:hypothetical protein PENTCL1PPCAC_13456 [Pristionchus entomophagus]|uniref:Uncharacterized protein n=1 Tax=Pristionchus entomophagus TaxID=358040 RepID=A0AAV5TFV0_9BILA|nr:hypothetical protein PENTCL1PPCAC_13456 [Pristionchus entomophagus]